MFVRGGRAADAREVVQGVDVLIVSIPLAKAPDVRPVIDLLPADATILDTSNYYPRRDGSIPELEAGQVESLWASDQYGRPVVKAWNLITSQSFAAKNTPPGDPARIALPVAADSQSARELTIGLVEETGFDGYDAGDLAGSWRQQPGAPAYCTDLTLAELPAALAAAVATRSPRRRELAWGVIGELTSDYTIPAYRRDARRAQPAALRTPGSRGRVGRGARARPGVEPRADQRWLRAECPDRPQWHVCHETIYQSSTTARQAA